MVLKILFISTKHESMQVNHKPRLDFTKSTKHECSYVAIKSNVYS